MRHKTSPFTNDIINGVISKSPPHYIIDNIHYYPTGHSLISNNRNYKIWMCSIKLQSKSISIRLDTNDGRLIRKKLNDSQLEYLKLKLL